MRKNNQKRRHPRKRKKVIKWHTLIIIIGIIIVAISSFYSAYNESQPVKPDLEWSNFWDMVETNKIESINIIRTQQYFTATDIDGKVYKVNNPGYDEFQKDLLDKGITITIQRQTVVEAVVAVATALPMTALLFIILWYILSTMSNQTTTLYKLHKSEEVVKFEHVAGMSETKEEVMFAVSQLRNADKLKELGAKPCKGIILEGPPGTGKTLMAKAIAGEANVPFISTNGADFIEMFVGLGAARVRRLWELATLNAPCVLFIDEIDAVGRRRGSGGDSAQTEANQTLNELLSKMDGLESNSGVFVVGATNRISDLDPALLRPGRFDKHLYIGPPKTKKDRDEIVELYMRGKKFDETITLDRVSKLLFGFTGAEIEQVLNEAVMVSIQKGRGGVVTIDDVDEATMKQRVYGVAGSHSSKEDIHITATHEAGHAVMNALLGRKVSKVSIIPYSSGVGGVTIRDTDDVEDKKMVTKEELTDEIKVLLAGRAAEQIILGSASAGCANDIEKATVIAYNMIYNYAMDKYLISPDALRRENISILSTETEILTNVNGLVTELNDTVLRMIAKNKHEVIKLADRLEVEENIYDFSLCNSIEEEI